MSLGRRLPKGFGRARPTLGKPIGIRAKPLPHLRIERQEYAPPGIMSEYELRTWKALRSLGYQPVLQESFRGGADLPGGMQVDFVLPELRTIIRVMSWWHEDPGARARDEYQKTYLQAQGYTVVDCWVEELPTVGAVRRWLQENIGVPTG